ncbi:MAG: hypothetical protein KGL39_18875, partial [Patescibacteria group bacterium]|nr:hypothetical protein [Patescibacteria group bacterium]
MAEQKGEGKNAFELKKKAVGPKKAYRAKVYTDEDAKKMLVGYAAVDAKYWSYIRPSTPIRYRTVDGEFKSGGLVAMNPYDGKNQASGEEVRYMRLKPFFIQQRGTESSWLVPYSKIAELYIKPDPSALVVQDQLTRFVEKVNENQRKLKAFLEKLGER